MVTLVGVAYRGNIALDDIKVDFEVEPIGLPNAIGFGVKETVTLFGQISEQERVRLERASSFCPVGQALTKGSMQVEDEIQWASGELLPASQAPDGLKPLAGSLPSIPPGTVHVQYLLDTKEIDESGGMVLEGEAKVTVRCDNLTRSSGWIVLGGHSTLGWVPGPFPLAHGGWAASTAATLSQLLPQTGEELKVELAIAPSSGGPAESQANAAAGVVAHRQVSRRITVPGTPQSTPIEMVQAALLRDPMSITYQHGGILLEHNVVVG